MSRIFQDQINLYLLNRLQPEEKVIFEQEMQNDATFRKEVQLHKELTEALQYKNSVEAKLHIENIVEDWKQYLSKAKEANESLAQTAKIGVENLTNTLSALVLQFFNPYSAAFRNAFVEQLSIEDRAFYHYNRKDYLKATPLLLKLPKDDQEVQLMTGNALLAQQKYKTAYPYFKQLIKDEAVFFLSDAHWYAGLCLIGLNHINEAEKHFDYLINDENTSKEIKQNAQTLLNRLPQQL